MSNKETPNKVHSVWDDLIPNLVERNENKLRSKLLMDIQKIILNKKIPVNSIDTLTNSNKVDVFTQGRVSQFTITELLAIASEIGCEITIDLNLQ